MYSPKRKTKTVVKIPTIAQIPPPITKKHTIWIAHTSRWMTRITSHSPIWWTARIAWQANPLSHTTSWIMQSAIPTVLLPNSGHVFAMSCYTVLWYRAQKPVRKQARALRQADSWSYQSVPPNRDCDRKKKGDEQSFVHLLFQYLYPFQCFSRFRRRKQLKNFLQIVLSLIIPVSEHIR